MFVFTTAILVLMTATAVASTVVTGDDETSSNDNAEKSGNTTGTKGRKRGVKKGQKLTSKETQDWNRICKLWVDNEKNGKYKGYLSQKAFLNSDVTVTGPNFGNGVGQSEENSFSQKLKQYRNNKLENSARKKQKKAEYSKTERMIIQYIDLRAERYKRDKCGVSWSLLLAKSLEFSKRNGEYDENFCASPGWLQNALRRNNRVGIKLHGEANDMDDGEREKIMTDWRRDEFHPVIHNRGIPECRIYNADQTGLYHQKLPNYLYVEHSKKKEYAGVKQMKDKERITLMVLTAADGTKGPLAMVGKYKKPKCFRLGENGKPPMHYTHQKNAWFNKNVTLWWILNVFWPWHVEKHGYTPCILLLDNCSAHNIDLTKIPDKIIVLFCPPLGSMIASLLVLRLP